MGAMMGTAGAMGASVLLWVLLALAVGVTGGIVVTRGVRSRRGATSAPVPPAESPAVREAKDALRLRYANGEISREEYLQGKVELED